jgi:hypothetical protein
MRKSQGRASLPNESVRWVGRCVRVRGRPILIAVSEWWRDACPAPEEENSLRPGPMPLDWMVDAWHLSENKPRLRTDVNTSLTSHQDRTCACMRPLAAAKEENSLRPGRIATRRVYVRCMKPAGPAICYRTFAVILEFLNIFPSINIYYSLLKNKLKNDKYLWTDKVYIKGGDPGWWGWPSHLIFFSFDLYSSLISAFDSHVL